MASIVIVLGGIKSASDVLVLVGKFKKVKSISISLQLNMIKLNIIIF